MSAEGQPVLTDAASEAAPLQSVVKEAKSLELGGTLIHEAQVLRRVRDNARVVHLLMETPDACTAW